MANMTSEIVDEIAFQGELGFVVLKDPLSFGIDYNIDISKNTVNQGVSATFRYEF